MFDFTNLKQVAVSALAAAILTIVSVGAAVGPARAIETGPALYAQALVTTAHV